MNVSEIAKKYGFEISINQESTSKGPKIHYTLRLKGHPEFFKSFAHAGHMGYYLEGYAHAARLSNTMGGLPNV